jgi:hypothetical protein
MSRDPPDVLFHSTLDVKDSLCHYSTFCARSWSVQNVLIIPMAMVGAGATTEQARGWKMLCQI